MSKLSENEKWPIPHASRIYSSIRQYFEKTSPDDDTLLDTPPSKLSTRKYWPKISRCYGHFSRTHTLLPYTFSREITSTRHLLVTLPSSVDQHAKDGDSPNEQSLWQMFRIITCDAEQQEFPNILHFRVIFWTYENIHSRWEGVCVSLCVPQVLIL